MSFVPEDFGGFVCGWDPDGIRAVVVRYGQGKPQDGLRLTPLNLLQLRKTMDQLVEQGRKRGYITEAHEAQAAQLPVEETTSDRMAQDVMPRSQVDRIAGKD